MIRRVPFYVLPVSVLASVGLSYSLFHLIPSSRAVSAPQSPVTASVNCDYRLQRLGGYKFINPLVLAEENCESERLAPLKSQLSTLLETYTGQGILSSASVYIKNLKSGQWTCINCDEQYDPGSLMKVPILITILRMEENNPGFLDKQWKYETPPSLLRTPKITTKAIELNHTYSVRELLNYMIVYSDNNAMALLFDHMDLNVHHKIFVDLGLTPQDFTRLSYPVTTKDYSVFMNAIYNASYLTIPHSEYAAFLLSQCSYTDGLVKGLPPGIKIAHKFGEGGSEQVAQLHESGIVYYEANPYLITVMTKGPDQQKLPEVMTAISKLVYADMSRPD